MNPDAITIKLIEAIWDACPWAAPQSYLDRKAGMNTEPPTP